MFFLCCGFGLDEERDLKEEFEEFEEEEFDDKVFLLLSIIGLINFEKELEIAYKTGKGRYSTTTLMDYHDLQHLLSLIKEGILVLLKDKTNKKAFIKAYNFAWGLDTVVREEYIPRKIWEIIEPKD